MTIGPRNILEGHRVLVTGGTGSLGRIVVQRILSGELGVPEEVSVLSRDEAKHVALRVHMKDWLSHQRLSPSRVNDLMGRLKLRIGDVRNYGDVVTAMRHSSVVINAAALKQVPNCEYFPGQAVLTNCLGPMNIARALAEHNFGIETVLGISTDKACVPVSVMGMTKALHERIFVAAAVECRNTRFVCTRYGNVLASRGSVVPLFDKQIRNGGPVTITDPEMTRFLMSLDEAVDCIFAALEHGGTGETFVPRMQSVTVENLAKAMIGDKEIPIKTIGIRPGERKHEILVSDEESHRTRVWNGYFVIGPCLPELVSATLQHAPVLEQSYTSADSLLSLEETTKLLQSLKLVSHEDEWEQGGFLRRTAA